MIATWTLNVEMIKLVKCTNAQICVVSETLAEEMLNARLWVIERFADAQLAGLVILNHSASNVSKFLCSNS